MGTMKSSTFKNIVCSTDELLFNKLLNLPDNFIAAEILTRGTQRDANVLRTFCIEHYRAIHFAYPTPVSSITELCK